MEWKKLEIGVFLVNVLAIIYNRKTKKILIGRRQNDPYLKKLTWCFPGGMPGYGEDLEFYLKEKPGELFVELEWVKPREVIDYFKISTSIHPKLVKYLKSLA